MKIAIIGAGVAGLSTGYYLSKNSYDITIYEATSQIGGRVTSFSDNKTGDVIDNGQHLLLGAYSTFLEILNDCNSLNKIKRLENISIPYFYKNGSCDKLTSNIKNNPLGLLFALLKLDTISLKSKVKTIILMLRLTTNSIKTKNKTISDILVKTKQDKDIIELLWRPIALATLNTDIETASMGMLATVLKDGFLATGNKSNLIFGIVPLLDLLISQKDFIESRNGKIKLNCKIDKVEQIDNKFQINDEVFDALVIATPSQFTQKILVNSNIQLIYNSNIAYSPIVSIYLWFDKDYFDFEFASFIGTQIHWVFNKRKIFSENKTDGLISITISAANDIVDKSSNEIVEICYKELKQSLKLENLPKPVHYRIFKEKNATILATNDNLSKRPNQITNIPNLYLAGCYTDTKYPSTIEGAALSGKIVAEKIISQTI